MFDAKRLLDAVVGAAARMGTTNPSGAGAGRQGKGGGGGARPQAGAATGGLTDQLLRTATNVLVKNPGLAEAALVGLGGLLFGKRKGGRGVSGSLVKLGGLALIGTLAWKALRSKQTGAAPEPGAVRDTFHALAEPEASAFDPVSLTEDDALLFLRAMVAAACADGQLDAAERSRIARGLAEAGIDEDSTRWLENEIESPADVEELAEPVNTPEKAAQVYTAARLAIDPDTRQEREFLRQLAQALDLDAATRAQIDDMAAALKAD
jgi:uncharacterized membrane protein YebE (DUF533 family)